MSLKEMLFGPKKHHTAAGKLCLILERAGVDLFIDVGANIGQTGLSLRRWGYAGDILSFEPVPAAHRRLAAVAARDPRWDVAEPMALGDTDGEADLFVSRADDLSALAEPTGHLRAALPNAEAVAVERTTVRRLDTLFADGCRARRPFLKIDAQGHDLAVLRGAEGLLGQLAGVQVEMSLLPLYDGEPGYLDILRHLHDRGFEPHLIVDRTFSRRLNRQLQIDGVFLKRA